MMVVIGLTVIVIRPVAVLQAVGSGRVVTGQPVALVPAREQYDTDDDNNHTRCDAQPKAQLLFRAAWFDR